MHNFVVQFVFADLGYLVQGNGILSEQDRIGITVKSKVKDRVPGIFFKHTVLQVFDKLFPYRANSVYVLDVKTILEIIECRFDAFFKPQVFFPISFKTKDIQRRNNKIYGGKF